MSKQNKRQRTTSNTKSLKSNALNVVRAYERVSVCGWACKRMNDWSYWSHIIYVVHFEYFLSHRLPFSPANTFVESNFDHQNGISAAEQRSSIYAHGVHTHKHTHLSNAMRRVAHQHLSIYLLTCCNPHKTTPITQRYANKQKQREKERGRGRARQAMETSFEI